mmetsp:Transcript_15338/g.24994  ORF Transcript_15338/g.24994 Transcript_15338/m.24994 type:complete len:109 (-) Transcript_15338:1797-2123(-)
MSRGAAPGQTGSNPSSGSGKPTGGMRGAATGRPAGAVNKRRGRATQKTAQGGQGEGGGGNSGMSQRDALRFYTDDAPGLKIGPTTVLVLSLLFIGFVVLLHIWGKMMG